jgi:predicted  nucleic acid-binding Zn-ribbon protein
MDVETSGAIEQLGRRIDALEGSLRSEVGSLRGEVGSLRGEVGSLRDEFGSLRDEFGSLRDEFGSLRSEVRAGLAENRRHGEALFESLRDDIRMLAEGFATLTAKLDSDRK